MSNPCRQISKFRPLIMRTEIEEKREKIDKKKEKDREVGPARLGPFSKCGRYLAATPRDFPWDPLPWHSMAMHKRVGMIRALKGRVVNYHYNNPAEAD